MKIKENVAGDYSIVNEKGEVVGILFSDFVTRSYANKAAAAPDLLEAPIDAIEFAPSILSTDKAKAAIAKAKGE